MKPNQPDIDKCLDILANTPRRLVACTVRMGEKSLYQALGRDEWSVAEILAHLRACEELWSYSLYAMLSVENPTLPLMDERKWAKMMNYAADPFEHSFDAFVERRKTLVYVLRKLSFDDWSKQAEIGGRTHSVFSQVRRMAFHELEHVEQVEAYFHHPDR